MRKSLHKKNRITIRFSDEQAALLEKAARRESERRRERVDESTLARELIVRGAEQILAESAIPAAAPAA